MYLIQTLELHFLHCRICVGNLSKKKKNYRGLFETFGKTLILENYPKIKMVVGEGKKFNFSEWRLRELTKLSRSLKISLMHSVILFQSHFIKAVPVSQSIYHYNLKSTLRSICAIYSKSNIQFFLLLYIWFAAQQSSTYVYLFLRFKSNLHKIQV